MDNIFQYLSVILLRLRTKANVPRGKVVKGNHPRKTRPGAQNPMQIISYAFSVSGEIPLKYTCDGENLSPPLEIIGVPAEAVSLAVIVHDPDAPVEGGWTHWTLWNINPGTTMIEENTVPKGCVQGITSFGNVGYGGPCPPSGIHHYHFKLYALDSILVLDESTGVAELERAIANHILSEAILIGTYGR